VYKAGSGTSGGTTTSSPDYYHPRGWWYGGWGWYYPHFYVSGVVCLAVIAFFTWQFGTKNGRCKFHWNNVRNRVADFSFWEVMWFAALLEGGMHVLNNIARPRR